MNTSAGAAQIHWGFSHHLNADLVGRVRPGKRKTAISPVQTQFDSVVLHKWVEGGSTARITVPQFWPLQRKSEVDEIFTPKLLIHC